MSLCISNVYITFLYVLHVQLLAKEYEKEIQILKEELAMHSTLVRHSIHVYTTVPHLFYYYILPDTTKYTYMAALGVCICLVYYHSY